MTERPEEHYADAPPPEQPGSTTEGQEPQQESSEGWFDETWTKVHPLSPLVRGWVTVVAIPVAFFSYNWQMFSDLWNAWQSGELVDNLQTNPTPYLIGGALFLGLAVLIFMGFTLSWWFTRYKVTEEHVMVKSGIFVRQHRQARIDRVQAVDLRQPLLARIAKLAELRFEVAEGDGTAATLAFLRKHEAEQLRAEIMDRAAGRPPARSQENDAAVPDLAAPDSGDSQAPPGDTVCQNPQKTTEPAAIQGETTHHPGGQDRQIVRVPVPRLIGSVLVGGSTLVFIVLALCLFALLGGIASFFVLVRDEPIGEAFGQINVPFFVPILIGAIFAFWNQLSNGWNFTATMTQAGLRLKYGLTTTNTQTVPPGRVQAIQIRQPVLWRTFGWYSVTVTVAGYGLDSRSTLLPVGGAEDVMRLTAEMFPDLQVDNPEQVFFEGLRGRGAERGFTEVPRRARAFDPMVRRRRGFFVTPSALMIRDGRVTRTLTMVPHERIQSAALHQGPLARMIRIATLHIHIPAGPITARAKNQDLEQISWLFEQEAGYAAVARRLADRNQWMQPEELDEFEKNVAEAKQKLEEADYDAAPAASAAHGSSPAAGAQQFGGRPGAGL
ncbi:PH domain-containing protein [Nesterenkonia ebinurensis]|uniref:PH domain-containing protein n=1 Tax=Nesterenkonia ebinurensis TaxID=2608252 RepID=UPI00123CDC13|nr:PH domain-containing protein [Nesterenkonia ebinurensis]